MGFFERFKENIKSPAFLDLVKEQNLKELLIRREFRVSQGYLRREFFGKPLDDEIPEFSIAIFDGYGQISGKIKKRLLPAISFSATFTIQGIEFSSTRKCIFLKLDEVGPIDLAWLTRKVVERIPFLTSMGDLIACDLTRVPGLAERFAYRVKGINVWDFITLKELHLKDGEIVGRVGVVV